MTDYNDKMNVPMDAPIQYEREMQRKAFEEGCKILEEKFKGWTIVPPLTKGTYWYLNGTLRKPIPVEVEFDHNTGFRYWTTWYKDGTDLSKIEGALFYPEPLTPPSLPEIE